VVVCTGGSQVKPNVPASMLVTWEFMASVLPPDLAVLRPFLPYLKPIVVPIVADFCAADPPGNPDLTTLVFAAVFAGGEVGAAFLVAAAMEQLLLNYLWYQACECSAMTTPAPPSAPALPALPTLNPPVVVQPPAVAPCATYGPGSAHLPANGNSCMLIPQTAVGTLGSATYAQGVVGIPVGALTATHTWGTGASMGANHTASFLTAYYNSANTFISSTQFTAKQSGNTATSTASVPAGATQMQVFVINDSGATAPAAIDVSYTLQFNCTASPNQPQIPCCPPDPILEGVLSQILKMVTLIQRQSAPFGYVYGANHAALSGHGSFAVSDLIGVSVDVTTIPSWGGRIDGSPVEYFDLGFVTLGTADGYEISRRIDHDGSLVLPAAAGVFTAVGYTLEPGVVVSIRELVREP
jgi:hypothetical protein